MEAKRSHYKERQRYAKFQLNDLVRVPIKTLPSQKKNKKFRKGYKAKWSKELFKVVEIHYGTYVPVYSLESAAQVRLHRRYYENELNFVKKLSQK